MWEFRLVWPGAAPSWWDSAWRNGLDLLARQGRKVEHRPDVYLVLLDRLDAGLKLRGGGEEDFDLKLRHSRQEGWELWEKCAFFKWDELEVLRLAVMLQVPVPQVSGPPADESPARGAIAFIAASRMSTAQVTVEKKRLQAATSDLLPPAAGWLSRIGGLAELVEITLPGRKTPLFSICVEGLALVSGGPVSTSDARVCSYPELLREHVKGSL